MKNRSCKRLIAVTVPRDLLSAASSILDDDRTLNTNGWGKEAAAGTGCWEPHTRGREK